jgi:hypothetical protein
MNPTAENEKQKTLVQIFVNNRPVEVAGHEQTGTTIKAAAGIPSEFKLYDTAGEEIANDQQLRVQKKDEFIAISGQDVS